MDGIEKTRRRKQENYEMAGNMRLFKFLSLSLSNFESLERLLLLHGV
jgi:hypothetical protein